MTSSVLESQDTRKAEDWLMVKVHIIAGAQTDQLVFVLRNANTIVCTDIIVVDKSRIIRFFETGELFPCKTCQRKQTEEMRRILWRPTKNRKGHNITEMESQGRKVI